MTTDESTGELIPCAIAMRILGRKSRKTIIRYLADGTLKGRSTGTGAGTRHYVFRASLNAFIAKGKT